MNLYGERDILQLDRDGEYYMRHVAAMTREGLHSKSDIAAELAWRDREIDRLRKELREQGEPVLAERVRKLDRQAPGEWGGYEAFEQFLAAEIDSAPEALRRLGEWLGNVLDEDHFATANRLVLGAMLETSDAIRKVAASKAAPQPAAQEQGEWVMVPREPTEAMIEAAEIREDEEPLSDWGKIVPAPYDEIYKAMLAAAPQPPAPRVTQAMVNDQRQTVEELRSIRERIPQPPAQEADKILRTVWAILGPLPAPACAGCSTELTMALETMRDYFESNDYPAKPKHSVAHRPASPEEQRSLDEALGLETVTFRMPRALHKQVVAEAAEAGLIVPAYIRYRLKMRADAVYERIVRRLVETPEGCIELARVIHRELDHVSTLIHAAIDRAQAGTKQEE